MSEQFHTIITHQPHLDEITAIWLLRKFGESVFPGVSTAKIAYWGNGGSTPDGRSAEDYEREGILLIGVGGGRFDEHPNGEEGRKEGDCAATLIAKELLVDDDPAFEKILKYVLTEDTKGGDHSFGLATLVKLLHQRFPNNPMRVINWTTDALDAKLNEQTQFNSISQEEFARIATVDEIAGPSESRKYKMTTIISDNQQASKLAMSPRGGGADIVIAKRSTGHVQIFTKKRSKVDLRDLAQILRIMEREANGDFGRVDFVKLGAEGKIEGAPEWFYHKEGRMLLNGSLTAKDVPPTKLDLAAIQKATRVALDANAFEAKHARDCRAGMCTETVRNPCSWYGLGLQRCRQIRYEMRKAANA